MRIYKLHCVNLLVYTITKAKELLKCTSHILTLIFNSSMLLTGTIKSDRIIIICNRIFYNSFADSPYNHSLRTN